MMLLSFILLSFILLSFVPSAHPLAGSLLKHLYQWITLTPYMSGCCGRI